MAWIFQIAPFCHHEVEWAKNWMFVANHPTCGSVASRCICTKPHLQISGKKLPDGTWFSRLTAAYPPSLAAKLAELFLPHIGHDDLRISLTDWRQRLPRLLRWSHLPGDRVEDGGASPAHLPGFIHIPVALVVFGHWQAPSGRL